MYINNGLIFITRCLSTLKMENQGIGSGLVECSPTQVTCCTIDDTAQRGPKTADSGYASNEGSQIKDAPKLVDWINLLKRKPQLPPSRPFESLDITPPIRQRYDDLQELFNDVLCDQLDSRYCTIGNLAFGLQMLGETGENAKPYVIVQCEKNISKKVKQFFRQSHVKAQYQPGDGIQPDLEVIVRPWPPLAKALDIWCDVYSPEQTQDMAKCWTLGDPRTVCGLLIKTNWWDSARFATLGGMLAVRGIQRRHIQDSDFEAFGIPKIYGVTVGHLFAPEPLTPEAKFDGPDSDKEASDDLDGGSLDRSRSASNWQSADVMESSWPEEDYENMVSEAMKVKIRAENSLEALSYKTTKQTRDEWEKIEEELGSAKKSVAKLKLQSQKETWQSEYVATPTENDGQVCTKDAAEEERSPDLENSQGFMQGHGRHSSSVLSQVTWANIGHTIRSSIVSRNGMVADWALVDITNASYLVAQSLTFRLDQDRVEQTKSTETLVQQMDQACGKDVLIGSSKGVR